MQDHTYTVSVPVCLPVIPIYSKLGNECVTSHTIPSHTQTEVSREECVDEWHLKEATLCAEPSTKCDK